MQINAAKPARLAIGFGWTIVLASSALAVLIWSLYSPSIYKCGTGTVVWSFAGTVFGRAYSKSQLVLGAIGGVAAVVAFIVSFFTLHLIGYFFHDGASHYFEDGFVCEILVYPVTYFFVYGPIGLGIGAMVGASVKGLEWTWTRCRV